MNMATTKLHENVYSIGVKDPNLRVFDIVMKTTHGTTYNSFLVKTNNNKTIIIDGVKDGFTEEWLDNIKEITPIDKIDVLIVNHTEPDHSGSIEELLKLNSNIEVLWFVFSYGES
jgi:flavorubredoxin